MSDKFYTTKDVCALLNISRPTLWRWTKDSFPKPFKIGKNTNRWTQAQLDNWRASVGM